MARITGYEFGRVTVDGTEHRRDLIVLPGRVAPDWWRRDGHSLVIEDLADVADELPERLVVGCGADGRLTPDPGVAEALARRGVEMEALPTAEAVRRYTDLERENPAAVAAALHLTC
ncbi:MAG: Mth938-like domain-containing protein [Solirubrobacterales bacterium]